jgi:hypothetical protein
MTKRGTLKRSIGSCARQWHLQQLKLCMRAVESDSDKAILFYQSRIWMAFVDRLQIGNVFKTTTNERFLHETHCRVSV